MKASSTSLHMVHITTANVATALGLLPKSTQRAITSHLSRNADVVASTEYRAKELPRLVAKALSDRNIPAFVVRPIR